MTDLVVVLDCDDSIIKTGQNKIVYLQAHAERLQISQDFFKGLFWYDCSRTALVTERGLDLEIYLEMNAWVKSREATMKTELVEGAADAIRALVNRGNVYLLSARNPVETENMRERLSGEDFYETILGIHSSSDPLFKDIPELFGSKKAGIAQHRNASYFVDDDTRHMPDREIPGLQSILFDIGGSKRPPAHVISMNSWPSIVAYITAH